MKIKNSKDSKYICSFAENKNLFISHNNQYVKLIPEDILWVSSEGNFAHIHTKDKTYVNRISLSSLLKLLPADQFIKIHKCFLVQRLAVEVIDKSSNEVLINGQVIPIGRSYKKGFLAGLDLIN